MLYVARQVAESKLAWVSFASTDSWRTSCQSGVWSRIGGDIAQKTTIGYSILPSGVILQWGATPVTSNGSSGVGAFVTVTRPVACPTDAGHVTAALDASAFGTIAGNYDAIVGGLTTTSFRLALDDNGASTRTGLIRWQAVCW
jgi:hypothetical protein